MECGVECATDYNTGVRTMLELSVASWASQIQVKHN